MAWGGPKWPRRQIPVFRPRRRRMTAWIVNGGTVDTVNNDLTSSLIVDYTDPDNIPNFGFATKTLLATATTFVGHLLTTFDDQFIEDQDAAKGSVNQTSLLETAKVLRVQGFIDIRNRSDLVGNFVGFFITHQQSVSVNNIDQVSPVDPTLQRRNTIVHQEYMQLAASSSGSKDSMWTRNINFKLSRRMRKNETLSLWTYSSVVGQSGGIDVRWMARVLISK